MAAQFVQLAVAGLRPFAVDIFQILSLHFQVALAVVGTDRSAYPTEVMEFHR